MRQTVNWTPSVDQLLALAGRAGGKPLRYVEVATLKAGIERLASAASADLPPAPVAAPDQTARLLEAALRLYADVYGLTREQAAAEVRAEAGL
ncbi:hypothetical protein LN042_11555 [Kitasatospora sp. RB6PN24]|uniref:hypothetical protein n=1 Tax=Kitasatospora humi TaxID=2893891 RepID=UPI001E56F21F|nr:hypothetical protein [Kitasatospora humi]MCC9307725.1 hypothetical protein [Kitasatospora humi]